MSHSLSANLQRRVDRMPPHQQAAIAAYREALNSRRDWIDAVLAAVEAAACRAEPVK